MRGMKILFLVLGFCYSAVVFKLDRSDGQRFLETRAMRKLKEISYFGLIRRIEILGIILPVSMQARRRFWEHSAVYCVMQRPSIGFIQPSSPPWRSSFCPPFSI